MGADIAFGRDVPIASLRAAPKREKLGGNNFVVADPIIMSLGCRFSLNLPQTTCWTAPMSGCVGGDGTTRPIPPFGSFVAAGIARRRGSKMNCHGAAIGSHCCRAPSFIPDFMKVQLTVQESVRSHHFRLRPRRPITAVLENLFVYNVPKVAPPSGLVSWELPRSTYKTSARADHVGAVAN